MHQINDFRLQSVIEAEEPFVAPLAFFPDATQDVFDAHGHWLRPRFQDPETGSLIFAFQSYVLRTARHTILIDSCIGNDKVRTNRARLASASKAVSSMIWRPSACAPRRRG